MLRAAQKDGMAGSKAEALGQVPLGDDPFGGRVEQQTIGADQQPSQTVAWSGSVVAAAVRGRVMSRIAVA